MVIMPQIDRGLVKVVCSIKVPSFAGEPLTPSKPQFNNLNAANFRVAIR
jgi:hypothetical protein